MIERQIAGPLADLCFPGRKIAFVSGPRQCGKTTLAKMLLARRGGLGRYWNWDAVDLRRRWVKDPASVVPAGTGGVPLVILDEIHKARAWKRTLKGIWDTLERPADVLVTGSARLAVYRKGTDSLLGRYLPFRLHPLSLHELDGPDIPAPDAALERIFAPPGRAAAVREERLAALLELGPFPEPLLAGSARQARLWRRTRRDAVIREDLRDLSRIPDLSRVEMLAALLPERVGSLLSVQSLCEDLEVAHTTVGRWLHSLGELYYAYFLRPFRTRIVRSLRQAPKPYLWDWAEVPDRAARFENLVAGHLLRACHLWTDTGEGAFDLHYVRDKEGREIDFLVTREGRPWLAVEAKLSGDDPSPNWRVFLPRLGGARAVQVVAEPGRFARHAVGTAEVLLASASHVLGGLP